MEDPRIEAQRRALAELNLRQMLQLDLAAALGGGERSPVGQKLTVQYWQLCCSAAPIAIAARLVQGGFIGLAR